MATNVNDINIYTVIDNNKTMDGEVVSLPLTTWDQVILHPQVTHSMLELGLEPFNFLITDYVQMTSDELNRLLGFDYY